MIKPNWDIFNAKFSGNPQENFEWFCYLLFCKEFDQQFIFRYKNQSAIETDPIYFENQVIGWQAKYFDSTLSNHKDKILNSLTNAKRDYPNITKILFYTNQEWGQFRGRKPKGQEEIETKAEDLGIILDWRPASFFESEFVSKDNAIISQYFFTLDRSVIELIKEQEIHTQNILNQIHTCIQFRNSSFEIDRNNLLTTIKDKSNKVIIINGVGGVGKTVLIKKLYEEVKDQIPFYVFKATEFELKNINDLFPGFSFNKFSEAYANENEKIVVIESSEKLFELKNSDPFKEFVSEIIRTKWKIIFTTRDNYLDVLNLQFLEIFNIIPLKINIKNLESEELITLSRRYSFNLPKDRKLFELLRIPFYLNEYLRFYNENEMLQYQQFKNKLWNQIVRKLNADREKCFVQIAFQGANEGQFYINPNCDSNPNTLEMLEKDGILGHELSGYFLTHDIYEEWGLEKLIESEYIKRSNNLFFFQRIGRSLPIRRSFRNWLSEKLLLDDQEIKHFIDESIKLDHLESFWKDEILISVLLSVYSQQFFILYDKELLTNNLELLKRFAFLLRLACKEVDDTLSRLLGDEKTDLFSLTHVFTKPKGQGWNELIKYVFEHMKEIGVNNISLILPVIYDWNNSNKSGDTTRYSSLIALKYYTFISKQGHKSRDEVKNQIITSILNGASEIRSELKKIFENIIQNNWKYYKDPYYDLSVTTLTELEGFSISAILPEYVLKIAELFWTYLPRKDLLYGSSSGIEIEEYFGLETRHLEYFPASAYQTPIYWLLKNSFKETLDFILNFTNKAVKTYADSGFDKSVKKIEIVFEDGKQEQFISHCLWNIYRGTSSPISPYLLQSIHMALEKYFLEVGGKIETELLEHWLLYLIKNSQSASISAVVTSIVLAFPDKAFNVARVLFKTKDFILFDTNRYASDLSIKFQYSFMTGLNYKYKLYEDERIKTCEQKHRKQALEHLFLNYQLFRNEGVSEETVNKRQKILWEILDKYYQEIPKENEQTDSDKTWRIFLARMDRRRMAIETEETEEGVLIQLNPKLDSDLRTYRKSSIAEGSDLLKYTSLKLWSEYKYRNDEKYKDYDQYESNPRLALAEAKQIIEQLGSNLESDNITGNAKSKDFVRFNYMVPTYVFSVLLRDYITELTADEMEYCKDVILQAAFTSLNPDYQYQISDGMDAAIFMLPNILEGYPEEREKIETILLLTLFIEIPVGGLNLNARFNIFPIHVIRTLWEKKPRDAQSLFYGFLLLAPRFNEYIKKIRRENHESGSYSYGGHIQLLEFYDENQELINNVLDDKVTLNDISQIEEMKLTALRTAFQLIPSKTTNKDVKKIAMKIISIFTQKLLEDRTGKRNTIDYEVSHDFLEAYAYFILRLEMNDIQSFLKPFIEKFNTSEIYADLFQEFIFAEIRLGTYDSFWVVWNYFLDKVVELYEGGNRNWNKEKIIRIYLFAHPYWNEDLKEWQALKENNKKFFKEISNRIGPSPAALYAIAKLLDSIGSHFLDDGVYWISNIIKNNTELFDVELEKNTIHHIENVLRKYMFNNHDKVKRNKSLRDSIVIILDFLVEKGSVVGYMTRESVI